ncbi:uncharacterized protein MELLADRAFT_61157 [Melampsora larici-populina 98AG31]|uniref:CFEM domain-containing protein n=1 Tax=Melampsora larici-populina (strain 98AG31 / pathotype 3-4-7) TaxID=747676 RepID=F4RDT8_MELLP|nr:uncharacterized protein MELLADRAFT_61157 [Melampsora larici-populina 98AG31]EGG09460.1 hypothetical protein MELLADRAFT_61157 [Melampsora larici-populina 98AG31]
MSQSMSTRNLSSFLFIILTFRFSQQAGVGIGNLPSCARTCLNQEVSVTNCSATTDFACLCSNSKFESMISDCFHKHCDHDEFSKSSQFLSTCSNYTNNSSSTPKETDEKKTDDYTTPKKTSNKTVDPIPSTIKKTSNETVNPIPSKMKNENGNENPKVIVINVPTAVTQSPVPSVSTATSTPAKNSTTESSDSKTDKSGNKKNETSSNTKSSNNKSSDNKSSDNKSSDNKSSDNKSPDNKSSKSEPSNSTDSDPNTDTDKEDTSTTNSTLSDPSDDKTNTTLQNQSNQTNFKKSGTEKYDVNSGSSQKKSFYQIVNSQNKHVNHETHFDLNQTHQILMYLVLLNRDLKHHEIGNSKNRLNLS